MEYSFRITWVLIRSARMISSRLRPRRRRIKFMNSVRKKIIIIRIHLRRQQLVQGNQWVQQGMKKYWNRRRGLIELKRVLPATWERSPNLRLRGMVQEVNSWIIMLLCCPEISSKKQTKRRIEKSMELETSHFLTTCKASANSLIWNQLIKKRTLCNQTRLISERGWAHKIKPLLTSSPKTMSSSLHPWSNLTPMRRKSKKNQQLCHQIRFPSIAIQKWSSTSSKSSEVFTLRMFFNRLVEIPSTS